MQIEKTAKHVYQSRAQQIQILMPEHINGDNRLFGGKLMEWIDIVAAVVARRHSGCKVTTACVDNLQFKAAAFVNSTVVLEGEITFVGTSSMEVRVDTFVEELDGARTQVNQAYLVLVALDDDNNPTAVPPLALSTPAQQQEWDAAVRRSELRKQRRIEMY